MTSLATTSPGIKPPTTILDGGTWRHYGNPEGAAIILGCEYIDCAGGGVPVTEINVTGSGYLQALMVGVTNGQTNDVQMILTLDGTELYNVTQGTLTSIGLVCAGSCFINTSGYGGAAVYDAFRFETGFNVVIDTTSNGAKLVYKYYLDS